MSVAATVRQALDAAGYTEEGLGEAFGRPVTSAVGPADVAVLRQHLLGDPALTTLVRLFLFGDVVAADDAARALAPANLAEAAEAGLVEPAGDGVQSPLTIMPFAQRVFAHDRIDGMARDHVAGIGPASRTLAHLTVRCQVRSALDVGTGCGVQALLAAPHADQVMAVDVNPRAVWFAELNADLNGVENIDARDGDLFDPAEGRTFDLVVANPPFVVSPDADYVFRDAGTSRDTISRTVVSQVPRFLEEGGFATILCSWISPDAHRWAVAPGEWVRDSGCDVWLLHYRTDDPVTYAAKWNEPLRSDPDAFAQTLDRWVSHYRREGINAISTGAVVLRRRNAMNWLRADDMPAGPAGAAGDHIERVFAAQDHLAKLRDARALMDEVLWPVDHRMEQTLLHQHGRYATQAPRLALDDGVGVRPSVPPESVHALLLLDGTHTVRQVIATAVDAASPDGDAVTAATLATIRQLFALGFLQRRTGAPLP